MDKSTRMSKIKARLSHSQDILKKAEAEGSLDGIDKVYVYCVNDGAVMTGWKKDQGIAADSKIEFVADTQAAA